MLSPHTAPSRRWIVSQIGAREHYAAARALAGVGALRTMYTDIWCRRRGGAVLQRGPEFMRAIAGRCHASLNAQEIVSFTPSSILADVRRRLTRDSSTEAEYLAYAEEGRRFATRVRRHLSRRSLDARTDAFFGYDTGCLETLELLRDHGILSVVDQIDPARVEEEIVFEESQRWPGWQKLPGRVPEKYWQRLADEWRLVSRVLANSEWSKSALVRQGVPPEKIIVVPLAYEPEAPPSPRVIPVNDQRGPLTVLWLGSVILRKGIQYLIEAAKQLADINVRFVVAGPVMISDTAVATAPATMSFIGRVTRDRASELYRSADVFVLPTISDGFAITQLEAMANGLPVITTPNCGQVVTDGVDGRIVPARDASALASAIADLERDRGAIEAMSRAATETSRRFSLARFADGLIASAADQD